MNFVRFYNTVDKHDPVLAALVIIGDAGIDYEDLDDFRSPDWWQYCPFLCCN